MAELARARDPEARARLLEDLPAEASAARRRRATPRPALGRLDRCGEPGRATADHQDVVRRGAHLRRRLEVGASDAWPAAEPPATIPRRVLLAGRHRRQRRADRRLVDLRQLAALLLLADERAQVLARASCCPSGRRTSRTRRAAASRTAPP